jgi:hypothetical protein
MDDVVLVAVVRAVRRIDEVRIVALRHHEDQRCLSKLSDIRVV